MSSVRPSSPSIHRAIDATDGGQDDGREQLLGRGESPDSSAAQATEVITRVFTRIGPRLQLVEAAMREQFAGESQLVTLIGEHVLASGGKRLRPALVLLAAELCGYTGPRSIQLAGAIELIHTATLMHDDVVDLADLRRGQPSANAIWGNRRAVLAGDFFYARSSTMIVEDGNIDVLHVFSNAIQSMAEGELLQLERSFETSVTESQYYAVIERKSASLLSAACETGALLAEVTRAEVRRVSEFGRELGLAFQLRDDALDYEANQQVLGKAPLTDLREGKVTLPLILALKRCTASEREHMNGILKAAAQHAAAGHADAPGGPEDAELASVCDLVDKHHGVRDTVKRAQEHIDRASDSIAAFPDCTAKAALLAAATFAVSRDR